MAQTIPRCVNHPDVETRLSCSSCGDPICTQCMRQAAVGQKCPRCARLPRSARARGKPQHYVKASAAALAVAVVGGYFMLVIRGRIGIGAIILPALLGYAVGRAVGWGAQRQTQQPFAGLAVGMAVLGVLLFPLVLGGPGYLMANPFAFLSAAVAGYMALRGLRS